MASATAMFVVAAPMISPTTGVGGMTMASANWGANIRDAYTGFFLRDVLGYFFPGAVLIVGLLRAFQDRLPKFDGVLALFPQRPVLVDLLLWASASYAAGVLIRVLGGWPRLLITRVQTGWFGDPYHVGRKSIDPPTRLMRIIWYRDEPELQVFFKELLGSDQDAYDQFINREQVFVHLTGNLGVVLVSLGFVWALTVSVPTGIISFVAGLVLIAGHYGHAQTARMVMKLRKRNTGLGGTTAG